MSLHTYNSIKLDSTPGNSAIVTWSGEAFDVYDPETWVFDIETISQSLSNICRFGGHVKFYSVAEHSVRVADILKRKNQHPTRVILMGLLHDATEAYIGDITRPLKKELHFPDGESVIDFEEALNLSIMNAFGLMVDETFDADWAFVKEADMIAYQQERDERPSPGGSLPPVQAKDMFMSMFHSLWRDYQMKVG